MKLDTVWKWWDHLRVGLCKKFDPDGVKVRPLPYDALTDAEQEIVYHYWSTRELLVKARGESLLGISTVRNTSRAKLSGCSLRN
jgi:hypothetical protein